VRLFIDEYLFYEPNSKFFKMYLEIGIDNKKFISAQKFFIIDTYFYYELLSYVIFSSILYSLH